MIPFTPTPPSTFTIKQFTSALRQELMSIVAPEDHINMAHAFDGAVANVLLDHVSHGGAVNTPDPMPAQAEPSKKSSGKKGTGAKKSGNKILPGSPEAKARAVQAGITRAANKLKKEQEANSATANVPPNGGAAKTGFGGAPITQPGMGGVGGGPAPHEDGA